MRRAGSGWLRSRPARYQATAEAVGVAERGKPFDTGADDRVDTGAKAWYLGFVLSAAEHADAFAALADALPLALAPGRLDAAVCYVVGSKY